MHAELHSMPTTSRIDETFVDPSSLFGIGFVSATVGAGLLTTFLYKVLAPLFTRITPEEALLHDRRKTLHGFIQDNPGATFREVLRGTDIPAGTARHHLNILERCGLVVEKRHRSTLRFFENHGKFDATWDAMVLLREEPLAALHGWIREHPDCMQKDILAAFQDAGENRSTIQHRLARLIDGGLLTVRPQGRIKRYLAHDRVQASVREDSWTGITRFKGFVPG